MNVVALVEEFYGVSERKEKTQLFIGSDISKKNIVDFQKDSGISPHVWQFHTATKLNCFFTLQYVRKSLISLDTALC